MVFFFGVGIVVVVVVILGFGKFGIELIDEVVSLDDGVMGGWLLVL